MRNNLFDNILKYKKQIMGFCALWIFLLHFNFIDNVQIVGGNKIFELIVNPILFILSKFFTFGSFGVDIFMFLTGVGLVFSLSKHDTKTFYKRRMLRILPTYIIGTIIYTLAWKLNSIEIVKYFFGINYFAESLLKCQWFTVSIIIIYLVAPIIYKHCYDILKKWYFPLLVSVAIIAFGPYLRLDTLFLINRIPILLIGVYCGIKRINKETFLLERITIDNKKFVLLCFLTIGYFVLAENILMEHNFQGIISVSWQLFIPFMFILMAIISFIIEHIKNTKILNWMGEHSLEIYEFSMVIRFLLPNSDANISYTNKVFILFCATIAVAALTRNTVKYISDIYNTKKGIISELVDN